jgi:hypothetical protein
VVIKSGKCPGVDAEKPKALSPMPRSFGNATVAIIVVIVILPLARTDQLRGTHTYAGRIVIFGTNGFVIGPLIAAMFITVWHIFAASRSRMK